MTTMVKCVRCNTWQLPNEFMSNDRNVKTCKTCLKKRKDGYEKNAEKILKQQKGYREDNLEKFNKQQRVCYENQKISNPLKLKFKHMISHSIHADAESNRPYERIDFINEDFLNYLWSNQDKHCFHCNCIMTLDFNANNRIPTQISIQRLNNDLPHIKTNCVLACFKCNLSRKERIDV
jgi:pyoverdine/dityrosine biosynthesis protein Dit1